MDKSNKTITCEIVGSNPTLSTREKHGQRARPQRLSRLPRSVARALLYERIGKAERGVTTQPRRLPGFRRPNPLCIRALVKNKNYLVIHSLCRCFLALGDKWEWFSFGRHDFLRVVPFSLSSGNLHKILILFLCNLYIAIIPKYDILVNVKRITTRKLKTIFTRKILKNP